MGCGVRYQGMKTIDMMRATLISDHREDARMFRREGRRDLARQAARVAKWLETAPASVIRREYWFQRLRSA